MKMRDNYSYPHEAVHVIHACMRAFISIAVLLLRQAGSMAATNTLFNYEFSATGNKEGWSAAGASLSVSNNLLYLLIYGNLTQIRSRVYELHNLYPND